MSGESLTRDAGPLPDEVIEAAADWFVQLGSEQATEADVRNCQTWRAQRPEHERAWQKAQALAGRLGRVPRALAQTTLAGPRNRNRVAGRAAAIGACVLIALAGWMGLDRLPAPEPFELRTAVGEQRRQVLDDGTELRLNTGSRVIVAFDRRRRELQLLQGEIQVHSGPDTFTPPRPLAVITGYGRITPIGTRFTVRLDERAARVAVSEGRVRLQPAASNSAAAVFGAGQSARLRRDTVEADTAPAEHLWAWTQGRLMADDQPLCEFLAELERYGRQRLLCDPALAQRRISGAFPLHDRTRILGSVADTLKLRLVREQDGSIGLRP